MSTRKQSARSAYSMVWLLAGLLLVSLNLRPALSSLAPLLAEVSQHLQLNGTLGGLLTTLPVLCLGLFAPLAPRLARRLGSETVVLIFTLVLALGIAVRSLWGVPGLFLGSLLAGASIGIIGVLLPVQLKREFPKQAGSLTGVYTMMLCLGAALAAGASVPLARMFNDWRWGLGLWAVPAALAAVVWLVQLSNPHSRPHSKTAAPARSLWGDALAWQVTLYMGLQSSLAYIVFGWLPSLLIDRGLDALEAGLLLSGSVLVQLPSALLAPWLATRGRDQRLAIVLTLSLTVAGLMGCLYASLGSLWLYAVLLGLGQGASFSLALALLVLRAPNPQAAGQLSGMAQGVGYTLASCGPLAVGLLRDWPGGHAAIGPLLLIIGLGSMGFGLLAGRARWVRA